MTNHQSADSAPDNSRLHAALAYALRGWPVFPLHTIRNGACTCGKADCGRSSGKHPFADLAPNGRTDATTDADQINYWWEAWLGGNIGIATGPASGLLVLDVDPEHNGNASLAQLVSEHGALPTTAQCRTGGGGTHYYFQHPGDPIPSRNGKLAPGLDVKADGGSVVAPPSLHLSGKRYEWVEGCSPEEIDVAPLPDWLLKLMQASGSRAASNGNHHTATGDASANQRVPESQRNETLTSLAGGMRRRGMTDAAVLAALLVENQSRCDPPLPEDEVERIAKSVGRYDPSDPFLLTGFPYSDLGNAQRLIARHGQDLRYVPEWGTWGVWDGTRWAEDNDYKAMRRAKETVLAMHDVACRLPVSEDEEANKRRKKLIAYTVHCQSEGALCAMLALAKSEQGIVVHADELDANAWLLNVANGTIDLRTGQLRPQRREDRITKCVPIVYDPQATCALWFAFLDRIFAGNTKLIQYVQRAIGYSLTGSTCEQCWFLCYGIGANGKSVFLSIIRALVGTREYARHIASETLIATRNEGRPRPDLARLQGARVVTACETEPGQRLAESQIKQMTGENTLTARFLYGNEFQFPPMFKLWLAANFQPKIRGNDPASWRRVHEIPFNVVIPKEQQDKWLLEKLLAELPGILNWAMAGCLAWQHGEGGLRPPAEVEAATRAYQREMDTIGRFIEQECITGPGYRVASADLYQEYEQWCTQTGEELEGTKAFGQALRQRGFKPGKSGSVRGWQGIGLREPGLDLKDVA